MHPDVKRLALVLALTMAGGRAWTEEPSPQPLPNGARVATGALHSRDLPPGIETGTPAASQSLPLGAPAAPPLLVAPDPRAMSLGSADASRPPQLTQDPISRSLPHRAGDEAARRDDADPERNRTAELGPAVTSTHDVADFPPGPARCTALADREERAACVHRLYDPGVGR